MSVMCRSRGVDRVYMWFHTISFYSNNNVGVDVCLLSRY